MFFAGFSLLTNEKKKIFKKTRQEIKNRVSKIHSQFIKHRNKNTKTNIVTPVWNAVLIYLGITKVFVFEGNALKIKKKKSRSVSQNARANV